jgi:hypothetical protein
MTGKIIFFGLYGTVLSEIFSYCTVHGCERIKLAELIMM